MDHMKLLLMCILQYHYHNIFLDSRTGIRELETGTVGQFVLQNVD